MNDLVKPVVHNTKDMFKFWVKSKRFEHPGVKFKNKDTEAVIAVADEIEISKRRIEFLEIENERLEREEQNKTKFTDKTKKIYGNKKEIYERTKRIRLLQGQSPGTETRIGTYREFREVIEAFNKKVAERLISEGEAINFKNRLGYLRVEKIKRQRESIDWGESNKYKKELEEKGITPMSKEHPEGKKWLIYRDDPFYLRFSWVKNRGECKVHNHLAYMFKPTYGMGGVRRALAKANREDPLLHKRYKVQNAS